jgi:hypothetical protein
MFVNLAGCGPPPVPEWRKSRLGASTGRPQLLHRGGSIGAPDLGMVRSQWLRRIEGALLAKQA